MRRQANRFSRSDEDSDINLTPMLDVVFIMLIFFIVTATFIKQAGIDVFRPEAQTAESKPTVSVLVAIRRLEPRPTTGMALAAWRGVETLDRGTGAGWCPGLESNQHGLATTRT